MPRSPVRGIFQSSHTLADEVLRAHLSPTHPYIEIVTTRSGTKAMVKGTRIAVSTIVGYVRLGESSESIAQSVLPHLTLAQIHDALSYYYDHQGEIEAELAHDTEAASQARLRERLDKAAFLRLTGQVAQPHARPDPHRRAASAH